MIPRKIFQTWETKPLSDEFMTLPQSWINHNPTYEHILFDKNDREEFIKQNFDASVFNAYCRIIPGAFKADLWRYCVLYIHGGVYADIDTICRCSIDTILKDYEFMTVVDITNRVGYNLLNAFIATIPKHPIMLNCIHRIVYNVEHNKDIKNKLGFSGPGVLGKSTNTFLGLPETSSFVNKEGVHGTLKLLKFRANGNIGDGTILFQNKNGNPRIKKIYTNEASKVKEYISYSRCKNPILEKK